MDKKRKLKEMFDAEYDEGDTTYFDDLKEEMHKQAQVQAVNLAIYLAIRLQKYSTEFVQRFFFLETHMTFRSYFRKYTQRNTCLQFFFTVELFDSISCKEKQANKPNN